MTCFKRLSRIIGALALAMVLASCSAIKLGYNALPEVSYWWLDSYLDFNDAQSPRVSDDLTRLQQWHRQNELPRYVALLQRMEQLAPGNLTAQQVCGVADEIRQHIDTISQQAEPAVVAQALSLTPEQIAHLARKYASNDAEFRRDWLDATPAERQERRLKRLLERSESIYGTLGDAQREVLNSQLARSVFDARLVYAERLRRQQDAVQTLRGIAASPEPNTERARQALRGWLERVRVPPVPEHRRHFDALLQENCALVAALHNSTTVAQREGAVRRLRAYQRDLRELAAQR